MRAPSELRSSFDAEEASPGLTQRGVFCSHFECASQLQLRMPVLGPACVS